MNDKQTSPSPASDAGSAEITSLDVRNIIKLIDGAPITVEQAELAVGLKIKLAIFHNRLLSAEEVFDEGPK